MCELDQQEIERRFNEELEKNAKIEMKNKSEEKTNFSDSDKVLQKSDLNKK